MLLIKLINKSQDAKYSPVFITAKLSFPRREAYPFLDIPYRSSAIAKSRREGDSDKLFNS